MKKKIIVHTNGKQYVGYIYIKLNNQRIANINVNEVAAVYQGTSVYNVKGIATFADIEGHVVKAEDKLWRYIEAIADNDTVDSRSFIDKMLQKGYERE